MPASSNYRLTLGLSIALALLTLLVYCRSFDFGFIQFDDPQYVAENPHVLAGVTSDGLRWAFTTFDWSNWHPLTWLSLQVDASFYGGPKAGRFHATNVLLHIANAVLLSLVLGRMTGMVWRSAMVAALFALHPLHVESVAWVSERKDVLSTLFWMLTMTAYVAYVRRPSVKRYVLIVLALTLGLMAKPMLITLPFVLLLLDFWPLGRLQGGPEPVVADSRPRALSLSRLWGEKLPLLIVVLGSCVVTFLAQFRGRAVGTLESYPLHVRFLNALLAYGTYLAQLFLPRNLAVFYPHPGSQVSLVQAMAAGALLLAISWLVLGPGRRFPYLAVGWLWYLGTLVPVIGLVQVGHQAMADRYTYVPMIGCFLMLAWGVTDLTLARGWPRLSSIALATVVLSACCALTWVQLGYWHDDFSMWEHTVKVTKRNAPAHSRLGEAFLKGSRPEEAEAEFRQAIAIDPNFSEAHWGLGNLLMQSDRLEEAQAEYRTALDLE
ncbi:MAG TPA: tetratricopeptide repeat protein, partial [Gemmataceae bacterium]|nr:tetratricopeptide repeat protein [Gemmataceae bacterium]